MIIQTVVRRIAVALDHWEYGRLSCLNSANFSASEIEILVRPVPRRCRFERTAQDSYADDFPACDARAVREKPKK